MGRPPKFNRDSAVETAMRTFWTKGYQPTSISDLANAMAITRSSFYNSFISRDALFEEALDRYEDRDIELDVDGPGSASDKLRSFFYDVCCHLADAPDGCGCLVMNCYANATPENPAPARIQAMIDARIGNFTKLVDQAKQEGATTHPGTSDQIARTMFTFLVGLNMVGKSVRDRDQLWTMTEPFLSSLGFFPEKNQ